MFRRRPFRRRRPGRRVRLVPPFRPGAPPRRPPLPPRIRQELARANRLMADGRFAEAAQAFEGLAEKAKRHDMLVRAGDLTLQVARAYFAAGDVDAALEPAQEALRLFAQGGRPGRIPRALSKMTAALRQKGHDTEADRLEKEAATILEGEGLSLDQMEQQASHVMERRGSLAAACTGCGAPLIPDEVEWHDPQTAECLYCGTIAKAT